MFSKTKALALVVTLFLSVGLASAQSDSTTTMKTATQNATPYMLPRHGVSVGVGFLGTTGDPGFTALNAFGGLRHRGLELAGEFNAGGTNIKVPDLTIKVRQQDYLVGPRFYFSRALANPRLVPFAHLLFGLSHQSSDITRGLSSADTAYAWTVGGGVEYHVNKNWGVRVRGDGYRTHFRDESQTHARYGAGVVYVFAR